MFLLVVICIAIWIYGNDMYYKENPSYIYTEASTDHPEKFKINKDTLNFW